MAGRPLAILGMMHVCPQVDPGPKPHVGGPIFNAGQTHVTFNGIPWAVEGGQAMCTGMPGPDKHQTGSTIVKINGKGVMRLGDPTAHGGTIVAGVPLIMVA
ncbi:MAG: PAAR domain-containing protein [Pseudomonadota bacterium]